MLENIVGIIPTYEPDEKLLKLAKELLEKSFKNLIVVNDGSSKKYDWLFKELEKMRGVIVLKHSINMGKGRALKTAYNFYLNELSQNYIGVVTLDSDGQHTPKDALKIGLNLEKNCEKLIMGVRNFNNENVPFKSRIGNKVTVAIMKFLVGIKTSDTQTGLRGIGNENIKKMLSIKGERFEYETNVLLETKFLDIDILDVEIETVYYNENKGTHFNPIKDSIKIYVLIFKFLISGISSAVIDIILFIILEKLGNGLVVSNFGARLISSIWNFILNKNIVFKSKNNLLKEVTQYYILATIMVIISTALISVFNKLLGEQYIIIIKIVVEICLFFLSFFVQNKIIFNNKKRGKR